MARATWPRCTCRRTQCRQRSRMHSCRSSSLHQGGRGEVSEGFECHTHAWCKWQNRAAASMGKAHSLLSRYMGPVLPHELPTMTTVAGGDDGAPPEHLPVQALSAAQADAVLPEQQPAAEWARGRRREPGCVKGRLGAVRLAESRGCGRACGMQLTVELIGTRASA